jgi:hypothetical protein
VPVSKHRKKKKQRKSGPPPPKSVATAPKKKMSTQQILIIVISALVVISMAAGYLFSGTSRQAVQPTISPEQTILLETPTSGDQAGGESQVTPETTQEPASE